MAKKKTSRKTTTKKTVEALRHADSKRTNIPTAEQQSVMETEEKYSIRVAYERRNRDLDPQLVWRGKDEQDAGPLVANAPPLYIQEKVHPKVLIDDLMRSDQWLVASGQKDKSQATYHQPLLFSDFNGLPEEARSAEFYQHEANWTNRMILGDSLQVMASLAEREGLRGKVQCIYFDPPYGIKFNSNFQWSTDEKNVKDGKLDHITREPEQVKAFRDTWEDGIHSYLTFLRDRLICARDLLDESGSLFVQISDENEHRLHAVLDEVFGAENFLSLITFVKTSGQTDNLLASVSDYILWFAKDRNKVKYRQPYKTRTVEQAMDGAYRKVLQDDLLSRSLTKEEREDPSKAVQAGKVYRTQILTSQSPGTRYEVICQGIRYFPTTGYWKTQESSMPRLLRANRIEGNGKTLAYIRFADDFPVVPYSNFWDDTGWSLGAPKTYVVQTGTQIVERCILMASDPGDLVLDPTCGSGTTAYVSEQHGRRWLTIDTSRVALALARMRIMGAKYPFFLLADSTDGVAKEASLGRTDPAIRQTKLNIREGFVYQRVPHITLKSIANNAEIDVIYDRFQAKLEPVREQLNAALGEAWEEWDIPRDAGERWDAEATAAHAEVMALRRECAATMEILVSLDLESQQDRLYEMIERRAKKHLEVVNKSTGRKFDFDSLPDEPRDPWPDEAKKLHAKWWKLRIERQKEIDASIAAKADFEYLYDKPYEDKTKVRVAGPFTVESLSPHRTLTVGADDELIDPLDHNPTRKRGTDTTDRDIADFATMVLDNLKKSGVQQAHKEDKIDFTSLVPWPGNYICAVGQYEETRATNHKSQSTHSTTTKRAAIFIGPEFGTISQPDLKAAARECGDAGFDVLISCGFNYEAHATEFNKLGRIQVLKARMNADMHMSADLKNTGKGNLFVIFGEPDVEVTCEKWLVTSGGRQVCSYEQCKKLSGLASLAEINGVGRSNLRGFQDVSAGRALWADQSDTPSGSVDSVEHRGGSGEDSDGGVSSVSKSRKRVTSGNGNSVNAGGKVAVPLKPDSKRTADANRGNQSDARRAETITQIEKLTETDFPLSLTTDHYAQVTIHGVDVFQPSTGEVRSDGADGIACWFIDTDYNEESFFVRQAYFLGANDPYKSLKTTLKAEVDKEAWDSLNSDTSRPFPQPKSGRIAVKVINHLGDEVMKVFRVKEMV